MVTANVGRTLRAKPEARLGDEGRGRRALAPLAAAADLDVDRDAVRVGVAADHLEQLLALLDRAAMGRGRVAQSPRWAPKRFFPWKAKNIVGWLMKPGEEAAAEIDATSDHGTRSANQ